ncbi:MAG: hypothetical protein EXR99_01235 [Gemmataceae bacterium]|nr:hypothetical protein [Gemmataceae bacterium]
MKKLLGASLTLIAALGLAGFAQAGGRYHYSGGMQNYYPNCFGKAYGSIGRYYPLDRQFNTPVPYYSPAQQYYGFPYFWQQQNNAPGSSFQTPTAGYHYYPSMPANMIPSYWYGH